MAKTPKRLAGPLQLGNSTATRYTAPAGGAIVRHLHVSNPTAGAVDLTLSIGADAAGTRLFDGYSIPADSVFERHVYWVLGNAEIVAAHASAVTSLVFTISGDELS